MPMRARGAVCNGARPYAQAGVQRGGQDTGGGDSAGGVREGRA